MAGFASRGKRHADESLAGAAALEGRIDRERAEKKPRPIADDDRRQPDRRDQPVAGHRDERQVARMGDALAQPERRAGETAGAEDLLMEHRDRRIVGGTFAPVAEFGCHVKAPVVGTPFDRGKASGPAVRSLRTESSARAGRRRTRENPVRLVVAKSGS